MSLQLNFNFFKILLNDSFVCKTKVCFFCKILTFVKILDLIKKLILELIIYKTIC